MFLGMSGKASWIKEDGVVVSTTPGGLTTAIGLWKARVQGQSSSIVRSVFVE